MEKFAVGGREVCCEVGVAEPYGGERNKNPPEMLRKHFGREKQTFLTYEYYYFQMGLMTENCTDDCADDCTSNHSCGRDMDGWWRWHWAGSRNGNHGWRGNRLAVNDRGYYARRLVYHNDIPAATVVTVCHSIMIALWLVAVLS